MAIARELQADLDNCRRSEAVLLDDLRRWAADGDPRLPSRLPEWTIGHVLAHLANSARGIVRMIEGAAHGEQRVMYEGGAEGRAAAIEAGSHRPAAELVDDIAAAAAELDAAWPAEEWSGSGLTVAGVTVELTMMPMMRMREVEVHHADLGIGYEPADWPEYYVRRDLRLQEMTAKSRLPMGATTWPPAVLALDDRTRLAWMLGRYDDPSLPRLQ